MYTSSLYGIKLIPYSVAKGKRKRKDLTKDEHGTKQDNQKGKEQYV